MTAPRQAWRVAKGLAAGGRFFGILPFHLRRQVQPAEARQMIRERVARRGERLLDRIRLDIFGRPASPYQRLMRHAGCEFGDLDRLVRTDGVETALRHLLRAGVYLTIGEFKGRTPVRRGSLRIDLEPEQLRSPRAAYHLPGASGGSRGAGTPVLIDLRFVRACAADCLVWFDGWGGRNWVKSVWETPGAGARFRLTKLDMFGGVPEAWFTQTSPDDSSLPAIIRWNTRAMLWSSRLAGRPLPPPVAAPLNDPEPVARWIEKVLARGETPMVLTFPGSAVRACLAAAERGIRIAGAVFLAGGEPITTARVETVRQAGCHLIPGYGSAECGAIGLACPHGNHPDEVHLMTQMHALIAAGELAPDLGTVPEALYITCLDQYSPFLMLNVSLGDQAVITQRACPCEWGELGLTTLLHSVRSYEKLTGGGVTFFGSDVIPILEEILPAQFGGAPTDYQLVEEESRQGEPVLTLRVHPQLGRLDEARLAEVFLDRLADGSASAAMMARMWRDSGTLRVVRQPPAVSRAGKILHLHVN